MTVTGIDPRGTLLFRIAVGLLLLAAALQRSELRYRSAFVDEAIYLDGGYRLMRGLPTNAERFYIGWYPMVQIPMGIANEIGGLTAGRAASAIWGVLTTLLLVALGTRLSTYAGSGGEEAGCVAGLVAGALFAVHGPSIAIGTMATYDAQSLGLTCLALLLWSRALEAGERRNAALGASALGGVAMLLAILTKYTAILAAAGVGIVAVATLLAASLRAAPPERPALRARAGALLAGALPLVLLLPYAWHYRASLAYVYRVQVVPKAAEADDARATVVLRLAEALFIPLLAALAGLVLSRRRAPGAALLAVALAIGGYHLANRDLSTLFKHTSIAVAALAPLAGSGVAGAAAAIPGPAWRRRAAAALCASLLVGALLVQGRGQLPGLRRYWSDTTELMAFMRAHVDPGTMILMEGGAVGRYELVARAGAGPRPAIVASTWGEERKLLRELATRRYEWVILDDVFTPSLNVRLRAAMEGGYELWKELDARRGDGGKIRVYHRRFGRPPAAGDSG